MISDLYIMPQSIKPYAKNGSAVYTNIPLILKYFVVESIRIFFLYGYIFFPNYVDEWVLTQLMTTFLLREKEKRVI
jgi:hypothetical protein